MIYSPSPLLRFQLPSFFRFALLFLLSLIVTETTVGQVVIKHEQPLTRILFILDASNSMHGRWQSGTKRDIAFRLLAEAVDSLDTKENLQIALRVYGHQKSILRGQDCDDTKLEVPFALNNASAIKDKLKNIVPKGTTPIALTLEKSSDDFPPCENCNNVIILITDGIEECDGDPCAVSLGLQKNGIVLKPFVIGIGLDLNFIETFKCVGNYYDASNEQTFRHVLGVVVSQALNSTSAQVNLLDQNGKPSETDVNMTFYDQRTGKIHYNYVHTLNHKGNPDTIPIDPQPVYRMVVHTIPNVFKDSISLMAGMHNIIAVDAPQGYMHLSVLGGSEYKDLKAIVRKKGTMKTLNIQHMSETEKYLTGSYDVEILCLPRIYVDNVKILQSHTTKVEIPQPGIVSVKTPSKGFGSLYKEENNELTWIYNLNSNTTTETITLQPGNYRIAFRPKASKESIFTIEKTFTITSGGSISVKMY